MYVPRHFALTDYHALVSFIEAHPFGIMVSVAGGKPFATHVPFVILDREALRLGLHVARANPQWESIREAPVLAIFHGAHDFVSASWYAQPRESVPTWNYSAVHCLGNATLSDGAGTLAILEMMVERFEGPGRWSIQSANPAYIERMKREIVAIEIAVTSIEGKVKFSQNRSDEDRKSVLSHLDEHSPALAAEMHEYYE